MSAAITSGNVPRAGSALDYSRGRIEHFRYKAEHNKREALLWFAVTICCSLAAPLFITLGHGEVFGKAIPAVLSTIAAGGTAWLQQRRPQQLWALYRSAERELENELVRYEFRVGVYGDAEAPEKLLVDRISGIALRVHTSWLPLVPSPQPIAHEGTKRE
jgi:hypothetical protein